MSEVSFASVILQRLFFADKSNNLDVDFVSILYFAPAKQELHTYKRCIWKDYVNT